MSSTPLVELEATSYQDTCFFRFPALGAIPGFAHLITSRPWNMATHCGPETDRAITRRRIICAHLGLPFDRLTAPEQIHSPHIVEVLPSDAGAGREGRHAAMRFVDGLVCSLADVPLMQFSADCPLLVAVEPRRRVFGTAHAGWRGTVGEIALELIRQLRSRYDARPEDLLAGIGPCLRPSEYEVGDELRRIAVARLPDGERFFSREAGRLCFDLRSANLEQLLRAGLNRGRISVAANSTFSDPRFYSYRREGDTTGRFALVAGFRMT